MDRLRTELHDNLASFSNDVLEEIGADGHTFACAAWYRLLDSVAMDAAVGGDTALQYLVVRCGDVPVCIAPVLRAKGQGVYFAYSLRRYYFEHWIEEAQRLHPEKQSTYAKILAGVSAYRKSIEWSGTCLDDSLIVTGPLSYRGEIPVAPSSPAPRPAVYATLIDSLQTLARKRRLPLWFFGVQGRENRLANALEAADCAPAFLFYDNRLDLEAFQSFDDYLQSFRRTTRRAFLRDLKRTEDAGIRLRFHSDLESCVSAMSSQYMQTYSKYGNSYFRHDDQFWRRLSQEFGNQVEIVAAERQGAMLGFSVLLHNERRGEMWTYRIGRASEPELDEIPYYFALSFYGPIRRAIERGYRRIWLGPASYEAKRVRGADLEPLYNYFWFPRRWDRWFLQPYLQLFGKITEQEIQGTLPSRSEGGAVLTSVRAARSKD